MRAWNQPSGSGGVDRLLERAGPLGPQPLPSLGGV
jgi:hypothetical protein